MSNLSRRTLVTAAAVTPALAIPAIAGAAAVLEPDPTFALLAAHRQSYIEEMRAWRAETNLSTGTPEQEAAEAVSEVASERENQIMHALAKCVPATMAGVVALLQYVQEYHEQAIELPEEPDHWHSNTEGAPLGTEYTHESLCDKFTGEPLELPFTYWVIRNARKALQNLAAQS